MMKTTIIKTGDGSDTLFVPELNEHYHSSFGAITESLHVFIHNGLKAISKNQIRVLEIGFGTGLNALLTIVEADKEKLIIDYFGIELHPIYPEIIKKLNYTEIIGKKYTHTFERLHKSKWNVPIKLSDYFNITKLKTDITKDEIPGNFDLIYFDAFSPNVQPEMWEGKVFSKIYHCMNPNGILVTYCSKGVVRRTLLETGIKVEKLPGSPGKREMLRAMKI